MLLWSLSDKYLYCKGDENFTYNLASKTLTAGGVDFSAFPQMTEHKVSELRNILWGISNNMKYSPFLAAAYLVF